MKHTKGFTLIELLVVVAIIGILATVVLASLGQARLRSKDAAVISSLSNYRAEAEINYPEGDYTGLCLSLSSTDFQSYIESQGGGIDSCEDGLDNYRIIATLPSALATTIPATAYAQEATLDAFCINSLGTAEKVSSLEVNELASPACNADESTGPAARFISVCERYTNPSTGENAFSSTGCVDDINYQDVSASNCLGNPPISCR